MKTNLWRICCLQNYHPPWTFPQPNILFQWFQFLILIFYFFLLGNLALTLFLGAAAVFNPLSVPLCAAECQQIRLVTCCVKIFRAWSAKYIIVYCRNTSICVVFRSAELEYAAKNCYYIPVKLSRGNVLWDSSTIRKKTMQQVFNSTTSLTKMKISRAKLILLQLSGGACHCLFDWQLPACYHSAFVTATHEKHS